MAALNNCVKDPTLDYEAQLLLSHDFVVGVDEAGRGAIAGPVAVGAQLITLSDAMIPEGLRDSKLLSPLRRESVYERVRGWGSGAVAMVDAHAVDSGGITAALARAASSAIGKLFKTSFELTRAVIILDGKHDWLSPALQADFRASPRVVTHVGADRACAVVAAASVRAKVERDRVMTELAAEYPAYGWQNNKGYGAQKHYEAIAAAGLTEYHRASWIRPGIKTLK